jgi:hypothetical protein
MQSRLQSESTHTDVSQGPWTILVTLLCLVAHVVHTSAESSGNKVVAMRSLVQTGLQAETPVLFAMRRSYAISPSGNELEELRSI